VSAESVRVAGGEAPLRPVDLEAELDEPSSGRRIAGRLARRPLAWIGGSIVAAAVLIALAAPLIAGDPLRQDMGAVLAGPTAQHLFGVDDVGRDVWSRVVWGARISLSVGLVSVTIALVAGVSLGLAAGYAGGWLDNLVMRGLDVLLSFPTLVLALAITASLGPGITNTMIAVGIVSVPRYARVVRAQVLSLREQLFVLAAQGLGASALRVCLRHILPNVVPSLIVLASLSTAGAILAEASLSFLGLGVQPPAPSWGSMLDRGRDYLDLAPWIAIAPGVAIFATVLGFNFLGDALRDALDPRVGD
jgi:ABC-type dipeptide/oligopeptide/nickel transport system permease subunit